jgi:hypothetical protein
MVRNTRRVFLLGIALSQLGILGYIIHPKRAVSDGIKDFSSK